MSEEVQRNLPNIQIEPIELNIDQPIQAKKGVGVFFCILTLLGTRLGAGIVGVPYVLNNIGYTTAVCYQCLHIVIWTFSVYLLLKAKDFTGLASLSGLGNYWYGRISIFFINSLIALAQLGYPIIFFIVFGDVAGALIERAHGSSSFWSTRWFTHTLLGILVFYLVLKKEIQQLKYAGLFLLVWIIVFLTLLLVHYITSNADPEDPVDLTDSTPNLKFFASFPTIISAYSINPTFFTAFGSLKNKNNKNGLLAGHLSIVTLFLVYVSAPLLAYGLYGNSVKSNMLLNVSEETDVLPTILQFIFMVIAIVHIPIIFFIGKEAALIIFDEATRRSYSRPQNKDTEEETSNQQNSDKESTEKEDKSSIKIGENAQNHVGESHQNGQNEDSKQLEHDGGDEEEVSKQVEDGVLNANQLPQNDILNQIPEKDDNIVPELKNTEEVFLVANPKEYLKMKSVYYYLITISSYVIVVLLSIVVGDVRIFFGIIGATTAWFVVFVGPGSFYIISSHKKSIPFDGILSKIVYSLAWIYMVSGIVFMIGFNILVVADYVINP